jgi:beta-galactosidase
VGDPSGKRVAGRSPRRISRRHLILAGAAATGCAVLGVSALRSFPDAELAPLVVDGWRFGPFTPGCTEADFEERGLTEVHLPHCVVPLSWWRWDPASWGRRWVYRTRLEPPRDPGTPRSVLRFEGVLTGATLFLDGRSIGEHVGGYVPFECELTGLLGPGGSVLAVVVDCRWGIDAPPGPPMPSRPESIDFYQPGGIHREVTLQHRPPLYVTEVFARPLNVLSPSPRLRVTGVIDAARRGDAVAVTVGLSRAGGKCLGQASVAVRVPGRGRYPFGLTLEGLDGVSLWRLDEPVLHEVRVDLAVGDRVLCTEKVRVGFREVRFAGDGFFLNEERVALFGLNRHHWFPYAGAAMPDRAHRRDAQILKHELNCTIVRCSHYPQSTAFLDACDELGLLVWEEAPGWNYIGGPVWRRRLLRDVEAMVRRDRNHPAIVIWGTRLNETSNDVDLYSQTRAVARRLDGTRPTTGAVSGWFPTQRHRLSTRFRDAFVTSPLVQDVFAYNDYLTSPPGELPTLSAPRTELPYLVSEAVGALVGPPAFRRTDPDSVQGKQALLHAAVHDTAASDPRYCGLIGWCAFDYPSGFGAAADGLKWPGVADVFRVPKLGAGFYRSQVHPSVRVVIEPGFHWDLGPRTPRGPGPGAVIWSNCDELTVRIGEGPSLRLQPDRARFPHLRHPPFITDLTVASGLPELRIDGYLQGHQVASRYLAADPRCDQFTATADDTQLSAHIVDATRVVVAVLDRYGAARARAGGTVTFALTGPAVLIGDNPLDLTGNGGVGAVWLRTLPSQRGRVTLRATHSQLGAHTLTIDVT